MPVLRPKINQRKHSLADPRHLMRFLKQQAESMPEDIAKAEGVSVTTVTQSIRLVDAYQKQNTSDELNLAMRDVVISSKEKVKDALHGLLDATELVERKVGETGKVKVVEVIDKTTRLEALRVFNSLAQTMQPKTPLVQNQINNTNQTAVLSEAETTEERFARLRKQAAEHNLLPPEVAAVPESIDKGEDGSDDEDDEED
jgi:hypothetical protein